MTKNIREYPMKNLLEWILVKPLTIISTISYFLFLVISIRIIVQPVYMYFVLLIFTILINLLHRLVTYLLGQRNSDHFQLKKFNESLDNILNMYLPITPTIRIRNTNELEKALIENRFIQENKNTYTLNKHSDTGVRLFYKTSSIREYTIRFYMIRNDEGKIIPTLDQTEFNFLVIDKKNAKIYSDYELNSFSGIIFMDEKGIAEYRQHYLQILSSCDKLDVFTKLFYSIFKKEFIIYLPWQTISLTRFINLKLLSRKVK